MLLFYILYSFLLKIKKIKSSIFIYFVKLYIFDRRVMVPLYEIVKMNDSSMLLYKV